MRLHTPSLLVGGAIALLQAALAGAVARFGITTPIPMHFDAAGHVNRWGDRQESALVILVIALVTAGSSLAFAAARNRALQDNGRGLAVAETVFVLVTSLVASLMAALAFGQIQADAGGGRVGMMALWLIMGLVGAVLGKIAPNGLVGVRTPWTFASRLSWDKTNRLAGRLLFGGGVLGVIAAPFAPQPLGMRASLALILIIGGLTVLESWRVWRRDPERRPLLGQ